MRNIYCCREDVREDVQRFTPLRTRSSLGSLTWGKELMPAITQFRDVYIRSAAVLSPLGRVSLEYLEHLQRPLFNNYNAFLFFFTVDSNFFLYRQQASQAFIIAMHL